MTSTASDTSRAPRGLKPVPAGVLVLALALGVGLIRSTPWGLGLTPDSVSYAVAAKAVARHAAWGRLPAHWPPLYPLLLAAAIRLAGGLTLGGRILGALALVANVLLGYRVLRRSGLPQPVAGGAVALLALQRTWVRVHLMLWSEPLFITWLLLDLLVLDALTRTPPRREGRAVRVALLGLLCSLAVLQRYAGVFLLGVNAVALLAFAPRGRRLAEASAASAVAALPIGGWVLFNRWRAHGGAAIRRLVWHPLDGAHLRQAEATLGGWFHLPANLGWLVALALALAGAALAWRARPQQGEEGSRLPQIFVLYLLAYLGVLALSISLFDFYTPLDGRILAPALPVALGLLLHAARLRLPRRGMQAAFAVGALGLALNIPGGVRLCHDSRVKGLGMARRSIQQMHILKVLRGMPQAKRVLTNGPDLFALYLGGDARLLPRRFNPNDDRLDPHFAQKLATAASGADRIVYFTAKRYRTYLPGPKQLDALPGFRQVYAGADGIIWVRGPR